MTDQPLDLDKIRPWVTPCGPCDLGMPAACTCPDGDPRVSMSQLFREVERLREAVAKVRAGVAEEIAAAIESVDVRPPPDHAYEHAAAIARLHRVPDCGHQYHGADGGPCPDCGFNITEDQP